MRLAWIIVAFAAIAAATVHLRLQQTRTRSEIHNLQADRLEVRRRLWQQQLRLGELTSPRHIRRLARDWPMDVAEPGQAPSPVRRVVRRR